MSRLHALAFLWRRRAMGEAATPIIFEGFQTCTNVVLRGTHVSANGVEIRFAWQAQHFRHVVLPVSCDLQNVRAVSRGDNVQITSRACHFAWQGRYLAQIRCVWNVVLRGKRSI